MRTLAQDTLFRHFQAHSEIFSHIQSCSGILRGIKIHGGMFRHYCGKWSHNQTYPKLCITLGYTNVHVVSDGYQGKSSCACQKVTLLFWEIFAHALNEWYPPWICRICSKLSLKGWEQHCSFISVLSHCMLLVSFCTPANIRKPLVFSWFQGI